jgi:hypothetical protein
MQEISTAMNFVNTEANPVNEKAIFNPDTTRDNLLSLNKEPKPELDLKSSYAQYLAENKSFSTAPVVFNHDLYKRYTDSFFGNTTFLDPRYYNNEEINAQRQSNWQSLAMGSIKALPMAWSSFGSFFTSSPFNYDNENTRELERISKSWEDLFPNFYSEAELNSKNPVKGSYSFCRRFLGKFLGR